MNSNNVPPSETSIGGFLSGFVESNVEMPPDGLNGDCIIHYSGQYSNCKMKIGLSNGMREGTGTILKEDSPFIQMEYHQGNVNGPVCRMDAHGVIDLSGKLVNGVESGVFVEYEDKKVMWRGYYRNGIRYSEVVESGVLSGYYDERSVVSGSLLSISQYDDSFHDKNGRCYEYENGLLKGECIYENGVKKYTVRDFADGKMIAIYSNGKKVYEGMWFDNVENTYLCQEPVEDVVEFFKEVDSNGQLIDASQFDDLDVHANGKRFEFENGNVKRVCLYENGEMKGMIIQFNASIMTEYDENGRKVYEGGFKGDVESGFVRNGYGKEYRIVEEEVISIPEVEKKQSRWTREIEHEVETTTKRYREEAVNWKWVNGEWYYAVVPSTLASSPMMIEELKIESDSANDSLITELKLNGLVRLKRIIIGDECFGSVRVFELDGLNELESVEIGQKSFTIGTDWDTIKTSERTDGNTYILNCSKLRSIRIGGYSFGDYHSFELTNLPSLHSISIGTNCYDFAPFILASTPD